MKINQINPSTSIYANKTFEISDAPEKLFYMGSMPSERISTIAIVGTRKPTKYGIEVTERLAFDLAKYGIIIVSGLAFGVDSIAHKATIEAGGITLAVIVNELPEVSPKSNTGLARQIIKGRGAIISEFGPGNPGFVNKYSFIRRNRIVSGLSDAIIITEAASKSGTLNTASHALAQGREVFVVPGNITSPLSEGCNNLLRQGATPVTCARDVVEIIAPHLLADNNQKFLAIGDTPAENSILKLLASGVRDGEKLQIITGLSITDFSMAMTMLEVNGLIKPLGANQWTIR